MKEIVVERAFKLTHNGVTTTFKPGKHTVEDDVASHWFVVAHLEGYVPTPKVGTYEYVQAMRAQAAAEDEEKKLEAEAELARIQAENDEKKSQYAKATARAIKQKAAAAEAEAGDQG